jgi:hypothetical protein
VRMSRVKVWAILALVVCVVAGASWKVARARAASNVVVVNAKEPVEMVRLRKALHAELQPIALTNCGLKRFGEANDGGYLLCGDLLGNVKAAYSYGISGYDGWGCQVATELKVKVHQYDCFNLTEPVCSAGATSFHGECVAGDPSTDHEGRRFDTPEHQIAKNGDAGRHLVVKMDVEGAEWETFLRTPDEVFDQIDQLVVEFHGVDKQQFVDAIRKLKNFYYVANLHYNNYSCTTLYRPFPAWAFEVLLVSKKLGIPDKSGKPPDVAALNTPNNPTVKDCQ